MLVVYWILGHAVVKESGSFEIHFSGVLLIFIDPIRFPFKVHTLKCFPVKFCGRNIQNEASLDLFLKHI